MRIQLSKLSLLWLVLLLELICSVAATAQSNGDAYGRPAPELQPGQSATLLPDGRWLLLGGEISNGGASELAAIQDTRTGTTKALTARLNFARAWHSATMLPDGSVLVLGGVDGRGANVAAAERFDPTTEQFQPMRESGLIPRSRHTTTLLTDGFVLVAGGVSDKGTPLSEAELWDPRSGRSVPFRSLMDTARYGHSAVLLPSEPVLLSGGRDKDHEVLKSSELYDPGSQRFNRLNPESQQILPNLASTSMPAVARTMPDAGASDIALDSLIAIRFSKQLRVDTLNSDSVTVRGITGPVATKVVPAEGGSLLFITPQKQLLPASQYTVFISGATDDDGKPLPFTAFSFTTKTLLEKEGAKGPQQASSFTNPSKTSEVPAASVGLNEYSVLSAQNNQAASTPQQPVYGTSPEDDEEWIPVTANFRGRWISGRTESAIRKLPPLQGQPGVTALAGQVLLLNGRPLGGVTLSVGNKSALTDGSGRFLLTDVAPGRGELVINGHSADKPNKTYGVFEVKVEIEEGKTNVLTYTIWMPRLDLTNAKTIASPTTAAIVLTTPRIPGLEIHLPAGTVIRDRDGQIVTQVSITAIPVDRPPFPLPSDTRVPIYFTIQPGGATLQSLSPAGVQGARVIYPNYVNEVPGGRLDFLNYDPLEKGWHVYGHGSVSADGKQIIPDQGVAIYSFTGAMVALPSGAPAEGPPPGGWNTGSGSGGGGGGWPGSGGPGGPPNDPNQPDQPPACGGDPVDAFTGLFIHSATDLAISDVIPLSVNRTYRPRDTASRAFGIGTNLGYDFFTIGDTWPYTYQDLILPDGGRIHYVRTSPGTGFVDAVYEHKSTPTKYFGSTIRFVGGVFSGHWELTLKDGTVFEFPDAEGAPARRAAVNAIRDRYGNTLTFTRSNTGNLTRIVSPNGRSLDFVYDTSNRIIRAADNIGRTATYAYDSGGRLMTATDPAGQSETYTYDSNHQMLTVQDRRGNTMVTNVYDADGRVTHQTYADGSTTAFSYTLDSNNKVTQTDITDQRGYVTRMEFNGGGYMTRRTDALSQPEQRITTFERDPVTNLLASTTDALGRKTAYTYDAYGNNLTIVRLAGTPQAVTETRTYEPGYSLLASVTDGMNHTITYEYDNRGNLIRVTDPLGNQTTLTYNATGQPVSFTDALDRTVTFTYEDGVLASSSNALGHASRYFADSAGRIMGVVDPMGSTTRYKYDVLNRVSSIIDALGGVTELTFDGNGNLLTHTDAKGGVISFTYDALNRRLTHTDALLHTETYDYDAAGNLTRFTDRKGQVSAYEYDALNRRIKSGFGATSAQPATFTSTVDYTFDAGGRLIQLIDSTAGTITRSFDGLNRLLSETTQQGSVGYAYDNAHRRTSMTIAGQTVVSYAYDDGNRLTGITQGTSTVGFTYDSANNRSTMTLANGIVVSYSYDHANRLSGITYKQGVTPLGDLSYSYDANDRRISVGGSFARASLPEMVSSATYNAANQLTQWGGASFSYDINGNMASDGAKTYLWDERDRLVGLIGTATASFRYDAFGRRIGKSIGGSSTRFLYDGVNVVRELSEVVPNATLLTGLQVDETFMRSEGNGQSHFLTDVLGSTIALADEVGAIQTNYVYEPYGKTVAVGAASSNNAQYTGRENDNTGLYFFRARYYDAELHRFVSEDPVGLAGGINVYAYANLDPLSYTDRMGLTPGGAIAFRDFLKSLFGDMNTPFADRNTRPDGMPQGAGCGDKLSDRFVPDCFPKSCEKHDKCYGDQRGRARCDDEFYDDMMSEDPGRPVAAAGYYGFVRALGGRAYANAGGRGR